MDLVQELGLDHPFVDGAPRARRLGDDDVVLAGHLGVWEAEVVRVGDEAEGWVFEVAPRAMDAALEEVAD